MNPFDLLDRLLNDYASPRARRTIHTLILLAAALVGLYLSVEGDWKEAALALLATLYAGANKANTPEISHADLPDDGQTYEEAGGRPFPVPQPGADEDGFGGDAPEPGSGDPHRY